MAVNGSRYHAEIKVALQGRDARINVFADTLAEIFADLGIIAQQFPTAWTPATDAAREIAAAQLRAPQNSPQPPAQSPRTPLSNTLADPNLAPICDHCGESDSMELIEFTSRKTGQPKRAWKCQACDKWHFPPGSNKPR
ncbi:MAG: hypothetical protein ACLFVD_02635 [Dehalococcoidia bacterium]